MEVLTREDRGIYGQFGFEAASCHCLKAKVNIALLPDDPEGQVEN